MSILVYAHSHNNQVHKSAKEVLTYAKKIADQTGDSIIAATIGTIEDAASLGQYGASKVIQIQNDALSSFQPSLIAKALNQVGQNEGSKLFLFSHDLNGKAIAPILSAISNSGSVAGAVDVPNTDNGFVVKKAVFSGKAFAHVKINTESKVVSLMPNALEVVDGGSDAIVETANVELGATKIEVIEQKMESTELPLTEAEKVVSAGRGLKGPENWGMVEELAKALGAATACSRPVSDMDWRPHHEHVGQTGVAIRPNLYIAIGISGAIQHLAGVNQSKVIVVINSDPEAPFFKSADYGIVGDAFEVVPKLLEAAKSMNLAG